MVSHVDRLLHIFSHDDRFLILQFVSQFDTLFNTAFCQPSPFHPGGCFIQHLVSHVDRLLVLQRFVSHVEYLTIPGKVSVVDFGRPPK